MIIWKEDHRVFLQDRRGAWKVIKKTFRAERDDIVIGEFDVLIFEVEVLRAKISFEDLDLVGCGGMWRMMRDVFVDVGQFEMRDYVGKLVGKVKPLKCIYWVDNIRIRD